MNTREEHNMATLTLTAEKILPTGTAHAVVCSLCGLIGVTADGSAADKAMDEHSGAKHKVIA